MAYGDFKDLKRRIQSGKVLKDKAFAISNNPKYDGYQRGLTSMVYKFFEKKLKRSGIKNEIKENQQLANELHKQIIRKFKKRKVYSSSKDTSSGVDLADMQLISKCNRVIRYLLCAIDLFSKYGFVVPLKYKKGTTIVNACQSILKNSKRTPKKLLKDSNIEMHSAYNEGKSVIAERCIRTSKNIIYKHMTVISRNVYFDVLNDIVD